MRTAARRLLVALTLFAAFTSFPTTLQALPSFYVEHTFYTCGYDWLQWKGYDSTDCDGYYYSTGNVSPADGDFRYTRIENCNTGVVRESWSYYCGGTWYSMEGPPSNGWCFC